MHNPACRGRIIENAKDKTNKQTNKQKKKEKKTVGLCKMLSSIINLPVVFIDLLADKARLVPATSIKCDECKAK